MDRNLGSSRAAISSMDSEAYGESVSVGTEKRMDMKNLNSVTISTLSETDTPGRWKFYY